MPGQNVDRNILARQMLISVMIASKFKLGIKHESILDLQAAHCQESAQMMSVKNLLKDSESISKLHFKKPYRDTKTF